MPFFILSIVIEVLYSMRKGLRLYDWHESMAHFFTGVGQQVFNLFWFTGMVAIYQGLREGYGFFVFSPSEIWTWAFVLLISDFCWYWGHRASHRINIFIASHDTHHQAVDFNHASALRQSWTSRPMMFLFFLPLALVGIEAYMLLISQVVSGGIQFLTHNGVHKKRIPYLDWFFVTPRTHFVHHGVNEPYLDKNFGGILIIWDRLFGTYSDLKDEEPVQIGSKGQVNRLDAVESNTDYYRKLGFVSKNSKSLWESVKTWFDTPERLEKKLTEYGYKGSGEVLVKRNLRGRSLMIFSVLVVAQSVLVLVISLMWKEMFLAHRLVFGFLTLFLAILCSRMLYEREEARP